MKRPPMYPAPGPANELNTGAVATDLLKRPSLPTASGRDPIRPGLVWSLLLRGVDSRTRLRGLAPGVLRPATHLDPQDTHRRFLDTHATLQRTHARLSGSGPQWDSFFSPGDSHAGFHRHHLLVTCVARESTPATSSTGGRRAVSSVADLPGATPGSALEDRLPVPSSLRRHTNARRQSSSWPARPEKPVAAAAPPTLGAQ